MWFPNGSKISSIPSPSKQNEVLLKAAGIKLPPYLANNDIEVATYNHKLIKADQLPEYPYLFVAGKAGINKLRYFPSQVKFLVAFGLENRIQSPI